MVEEEEEGNLKRSVARNKERKESPERSRGLRPRARLKSLFQPS